MTHPRCFQSFEKTTYSKLSMAVHSFFTKNLIFQLCVHQFLRRHRNRKFYVDLTKIQLFDIILSSSNFRNSLICTFHKHSGLILC